jgi:hypothetical protein
MNSKKPTDRVYVQAWRKGNKSAKQAMWESRKETVSGY